jgi:hypothetical protein
MDLMSPSAEKKGPGPGQNEYKYWMREIGASRKRAGKWHKLAKRIVDIYEAETEHENSFNILYSNTETLAPAIYTNLPRPDIRRRWPDGSPVAQAGAKAIERVLVYLLDTPDNKYTSFDKLFTSSVKGALLPGQGGLRLKYDPEFVSKVAKAAESEGEPNADHKKKGEEANEGDTSPSNAVVIPEGGDLGKPPEGEEPIQDKLVYETICGVEVSYDEVLFGPGKCWEDLPWIDFVHQMTKADVKANFGKSWAEKIKYAPAVKYDEHGSPVQSSKSETEDVENSDQHVACVHEIWYRNKRSVIFLAESYKDGVISRETDPLGLSGFFPMAQPLSFLRKLNSLTPTPIYKMYENQAKELNRVSIRINKILDAMKVRGFYDGTLKQLQDLMTRPENTLLPLDGALALPQGRSLKDSIWLMPIENLITVLQQLYVQRESTKTVIYEITGISDILRGSSAASETLGAQQIKQQWGTMRISVSQEATATYIRDTMRLMAELSVNKFGEDTWAAMTGLPYISGEEKEQAVAMLKEMQSQQAMQPPQMGPDGQPVPPQPDPQMQELEQKANTISWTEVLGLLRDTLTRQYVIDVETDSTIATDTAEDQKNIGELMQGINQVVQSFTPLLQQGLPLSALKAILLTVMAKFRMGSQVEDSIKAMPDQLPPPAPPPVDPTKEAEGKLKIELANMKLEEGKQKHALEMEKLAAEKEFMAAELDIKRMELDIKKQDLLMKQQNALMMGDIAARNAMIKPQPRPNGKGRPNAPV